MKKILFVLILLFLPTIVFSKAVDNNWLKPQWWSTATVEDVKAKIASGVDINEKEIEYGKTALIVAAPVTQNPEIVKLLIENGADVNAKSKGGMTALMYTVGWINPNLKVIKILIENGADLEAKTTTGKTALDFLKDNKELSASKYKKIEKLLKDKKKK